MTPQPDLSVRPARTGLRSAAVAVLAAVGLLRLVATLVFTFATAPEDGGVGTGQDWVYAGWSALMALALLGGAAALATGARRAWTTALVVLAADLVFTAVKGAVYDEPEALVFGVVDLVVLGLLAVDRRRG